MYHWWPCVSWITSWDQHSAQHARKCYCQLPVLPNLADVSDVPPHLVRNVFTLASPLCSLVALRVLRHQLLTSSFLLWASMISSPSAITMATSDSPFLAIHEVWFFLEVYLFHFFARCTLFGFLKSITCQFPENGKPDFANKYSALFGIKMFFWKFSKFLAFLKGQRPWF